jgi:Asp-tRNA(Asn)/Glu-tRNA(Gln) amidotransferase A subunit family amidase
MQLVINQDNSSYGSAINLEQHKGYFEGPPGFIPIPSRHYYPEDFALDRPLFGMRVAVKDIYDVRGVRTTAGSRAYTKLQSPATRTADCIEKLISLGAVIVGKTKTVQFASGMAAADWEDYPCPINPRGDMYLDPDCSSSGSGACIAGYDWLDFAIGSDSE